MTVYTETKECYTGLPYKFRMRVFGKYDKEVVRHAPTYTNMEYADLDDYDGFSYNSEEKKKINATRIGSPTVSGYEVSGFSTSKYMEIPYTFSNSDSWEILVKFKSSSNSATGHIFSSMAGVGGEYAGVDISLSSGKLMLQLGMNGSSYDTITAASAVTANTYYWVKATFQYSQFFTNVCSFDYSTDGVNFTNIGTLTPSGRLYNSLVTRIGVYGNNVKEAASTCTIDMEKSYVKLNDVVVWRGAETECTLLDFTNTTLPWKWNYQRILKNNLYALASKDDTVTYYGNVLNGTVNGKPLISPDKVMSEFSTDNYLTMLSQWKPSGNPWKIHLRVTTGSGTNDTLFGQSSTNRTTPQLALVNKVLKIYLASSTSAWDISSGDSCSIELEPNTSHDIDVEFTGTAYTISVDGVVGLTLNNSTPVYSGNYPFILGYDSGNNPFTGSVHLGESYIEFNGVEVWRGFSKDSVQGCLNGDEDLSGHYYCYAINGDDHIEMIKKTGSVIDTRPRSPRYLGEVSV